MKNYNVPLDKRTLLTITEASMLSGIGITRIKEAIKQPDCPYLFLNGRKQLIKRNEFLDYIKTHKMLIG